MNDLIDLQQNSPKRLLKACGLRIVCVAGRVWITAYGEARDIELVAGQSYVVPNHRLVLMEAVGKGVWDARVRLENPGTPATSPVGWVKPTRDLRKTSCPST